MVTYKFSDETPLKIKNAKAADPQVIGEALDQIRVASGGELQPIAVVDAARALDHPLHSHFEWDDSIAAESYRVSQARAIIRIVRVVDPAADDGARAFISIASDRGTSYRSLADVRNSADLRDSVLAAAERDLEAFERRYKNLREVLEYVAAAKVAVRNRRQIVRNEGRPSA